MSPVVSPLELATGLTIFNGFVFYRLHRALHGRATMQGDVRTVWAHAVGLLVVVNGIVLGLTGYLWVWVEAVLPG
ncbi:MAG: hypothetical protein EON90_05685 [Brevundimonas sp.]|nr:MAG: hypothetical protein EON90_05685 [Brevundimonas sp.]